MLNQKGFAQIALVVFLLVAIAISVYLIQQQTNIFSKAAILKPSGPETSFSLVGQDECSGLLCILKLQKGIQVEETFQVEVFVRSDIDEANLFTAKIKFPKDLIEVKNINTDSSFIKEWVENFYDNNEGTISLVGGVPDPGFKTEQGKDSALMATITFKTRDIGKGTLFFSDDSLIYRNTDNLNILTVKRNLDLSISTKPTPTPSPSWVIYQNNPIIKPDGGAEDDNIYAPDVHKEGNIYKMWYGGQGEDGHDRIFYATSNDGINWQKHGVVLDNGASNHVNDPSVVRVDGTYYMYYTDAAEDINDRIHLAISNDGINWQKRGLVIDTGSDWEKVRVGRPSVIYENNQFKIWYDGTGPSGRHVGYATSIDGLRWQKYSSNPVYLNAGAIDVKRVGNQFIMLYESGNGTYWATGTSETNFTSQGLLLPKTGGDQDAYGHITPMIYIENGQWQRIYFAGASHTCWCKNRIFLAVNTTIGPSPSPTPTSIPSPTPPSVNKGDGNKDGKINLTDMSVLLSDFNKEQGFRELIDMNDDKKINTFDFSLHRQLLIELKVIQDNLTGTYPCPSGQSFVKRVVGGWKETDPSDPEGQCISNEIIRNTF